MPPTGDVAAYNGTTNLPAALDNAISAKLTINVFCAVTDPSSLGVFKFKVSPARVIVLAEPDIVTLPKISTDPVTCNEPETIADPVYGKVATFGANDADVAVDETADADATSATRTTTSPTPTTTTLFGSYYYGD